MVTPEIEQYIAQQRAAGYDDTAIAFSLQRSGWSEFDINAALQHRPSIYQYEYKGLSKIKLAITFVTIAFVVISIYVLIVN